METLCDLLCARPFNPIALYEAIDAQRREGHLATAQKFKKRFNLRNCSRYESGLRKTSDLATIN